jgi:DNA-binding Lrp family transcriptional regulator
MPKAFVFINTVPEFMSQVLEEIRRIEGVEEAETVYGNYDIVVKVETETMDQLKRIVTFKIRMLPKVLTTNSLLVVPPE